MASCPQVISYEWFMGRQSTNTFFRLNWVIDWSEPFVAATKLRWVSMTPLLVPVVPEVKKNRRKVVKIRLNIGECGVAALIKHTADLKKLVESDDIVLCAVLSLVDDRDEILHGGKPVGIVYKASVEACGIYYGAGRPQCS